MATWKQLREGVSRAWGSFLDGWNHLYENAAEAIARFAPGVSRQGNAGDDTLELARRSAGWGVLAAEVFDNAKKVVVRLEAPGLEADAIDLRVVDNMLVVRGEKRLQRQHDRGQYHVLECAYGAFERAIPLPDQVEPGKAKATCKHGVLNVELPKLASGKRTRFQIKVN